MIINSDKLILFYYPPFAGGKFLINCLALSKHAVFQDKNLAMLDYKLHNKKNYYEWKLKTALDSLPKNKNDCINWQNYEYGCSKLFNWSLDDDFDSCRNFETLSNEIKFIVDKNNVNFFIIAHNEEQFNKAKSLFKNMKILTLINYENFLNIAIKLKSLPNKNYKKNNLYFVSHQKKLTFDYTVNYLNILEEDKFLIEIKNLYEKLGYDDFNIELVRKFYQNYIFLHL